MITLSHANRLPVTIQYPYEKLITAERFRGRIHFEFDKCIACEVCVRVSKWDPKPLLVCKKKIKWMSYLMSFLLH
ncbi:NAD(P)H-quinone oxidoreductase subunit i chloroplastic [Phtheirospermum japonicum]|uniref:NAD(P)H-quinone oxidoreductase subunit i chloroplastic n=1 Tax=Phtheirospermum japonicum TaxID=374723 RepID=A0A830C241_9LAMI|nr:NAD(P)H-quinone oxidoreductase subunit i chloroplastic [Phtheirospermum japonicum]